MKRCPTCAVEKPREEFYSDRRTPDGLKSQCRKCHCAGTVRTRDPALARKHKRESARRLRAADPERFRAQDRARTRPRDERVRARASVHAALRRGAMEKPSVCVRAVEAKLRAAEQAVRDARRELDAVVLEHGSVLRAEALDREPSMSVDELREAIADAARDHGGDCARRGAAHTSASWLVFRGLLARLAQRAERAERAGGGA